MKYALFSILLLASSSGWGSCMENARDDEEINVCQHALAKELEYKLRDLEKDIKSHLKGTQKDRFNDSQVHWRKMTERDCQIEADFYEGATVYPAILSQCLQKHYRDRINQVRNYLCPEHSLSTDCPQSEKYKLTDQPAS